MTTGLLTTGTPAAAGLELSLRATNSAAPTMPIATAVPTDKPPAADPALASVCAFTPTIGAIVRTKLITATRNLFFILIPYFVILTIKMILNTKTILYFLLTIINYSNNITTKDNFFYFN